MEKVVVDSFLAPHIRQGLSANSEREFAFVPVFKSITQPCMEQFAFWFWDNYFGGCSSVVAM